MKKKILIVGNEANAYSLAVKLSVDYELFITTTNNTVSGFATCLDIREDNIPELLEFVMENGIDMTVALSGNAIKNDIASVFAKNKQLIFAPTSNAAQITYDKVKAKKTLYKLHIPTPKFGIFDKQNVATDYLKSQKIPFVIKTNERNSATILTSFQSAKNITDSIFIDKNNRLIVEDYVYGTPFSFYAITDGYKALPFGSSITYKHSLEGNGGQLTEGRGCCSPNYKLSVENEYELMDNVIYPTLEMLQREETPYIGIIGVNGIKTDNGNLYILGWQSFLQNCDCAAILDVIDENLYNLFKSCIIGSFSDEVESIRQKSSYAVSLVLSNINKNNNENIIEGLDNLDENTTLTLYNGVKKNKFSEFEANYGNVLMLTSTSGTVSSAASKVYSEAKEINFRGLSYRKDICETKL